MIFILLVTLVHTVFCGCPSEYVYLPHAEKCVQYMTYATTFEYARDNCQQRGGDLLSVPNAFVNSALRQLQGDDELTYLGVQLSYRSPPRWADGTNFSYNKWAPGQPSIDFGCGVLSSNDSNWYTVYCSQRLHSFCEHVLIPECPNDWILYYGYCYNFRNSQALTSDEAEQDCVRDGAHLASIHSREENDVIADLLNAKNGCAAQWIGLRCSHEMSWSDGSPVDYRSESLSCSVTQYAMYTGKDCFLGHGSWTDMSSGKALAARVCKSSAMPCRDGWRSYNGACYVFKETKELTFEQAEQDCQRDNGHLASIHNDEENKVVADFLFDIDFCGTLWIGIECAGGGLLWTDGSAVDYQEHPLTCSGTSTRYEMYGGKDCGGQYPVNGTWMGTTATHKLAGHVCMKPSSSQ